MSFGWLAHHSAPGRGAGRRLRCAYRRAPWRPRVRWPPPAGASRPHQPTLAPANTVVDGPSPDIRSLNGLAIARDGGGALVYTKTVGAVAHVFLSRLTAGAFQPPVQVDAGLAGPSSQPVVAAAQNGLVLVAFINGATLYVAQATSATSPLSAPAALFAAPPTRRSPSRTSARPISPSRPPPAPAAATCVRPTTSRDNGGWSQPRWTPPRPPRPEPAPAGRTWPPPATGWGSWPGARRATSTRAG